LAISIFQISCEENISYLGKFKQQYSLNCILRSDKDIQFATIKSNYAPGEDNLGTDIENATIRLMLPDTTLQFKDSVLSNASSEVSSVNSFYYLDNYILTKDTRIDIEALLPDGTMLTATTHSADYYSISLITEGVSPPLLPFESLGDKIIYQWSVFGNDGTVFFGPGFYIKYFLSDSEDVVYYKELKGRYIQQINSYEIPASDLDETMQNLSVGIENKSTINIIGACFEVKVFDAALALYANSIKTFEDEFSVRLSEPNISNINGGLGIFGTYISEKFDIGITSEYIESFGYTPVAR